MAIKSADQITIVDVTDAYSVNLTTDSFSFNGNASGAVASETTVYSTVQVAKGGTALTSSQVSIGTITKPTGVDVTVGNDGLTLNITVKTTCTGGNISIPITIDGEVNFTKTISISVAKTGGTGPGAYIYTVNASPDAVVKNASGAYNPASITFSSTRAQGTGNPSAYSGRFKIEYTTDGTSWTSGYTSSSNEASKSYSVPSGALIIRCSLYLAGGTSTLLGIKSVPIITDGTNGTNGTNGKGVSSITGHYLATNASSGVTTSTSGWTTGIQAISADKPYLWYYETITYVNPSSTSNTTPVIIGHYGDDGVDGADAITITIASDNGTVFKNATGNTTLTARVFVGGNEATVASNGTVTYGGVTLGTIKWYEGSSTSGTASKTKTINAQNVTNTLLITCNLEG